MLARLQQFIVFVLLLASLGSFWIFSRIGIPVWGFLIAAVIVLGYTLFLALEFVALSVVQVDPASRPSRVQLIQAWWGEVLSAPRVFLWRQPFRSQAEPDHLPATPSRRRGVILVHGFVCNRGLWNPWMRMLRERDVPYIAVNMEPVFGSIDRYVSIIEEAVTKVQTATGQPVVIVGHSMGGLAIRAWLREFNGDARVHRVITVASPHHGTWMARFGQTLNGQQMRQDSEWLQQLALQEPMSRAAIFTCFYGHCDNIVFPVHSGTLNGAMNIHVPGTAHVHMAFHPFVFNEVLRWLNMAPAVAAQPAEDIEA